jgi:hypothetical protein
MTQDHFMASAYTDLRQNTDSWIHCRAWNIIRNLSAVLLWPTRLCCLHSEALYSGKSKNWKYCSPSSYVVLCSSETWLLTLTEEHRLTAIENNVLNEILCHTDYYFLNTSKATLLNEQLDKLNRFLHFVIFWWIDKTRKCRQKTQASWERRLVREANRILNLTDPFAPLSPQTLLAIYKTAMRDACVNAVYKTRMSVLSLMK